MDSAGDLPKEGLPHSDIRGSTIARISPRLFAACHVLHRLLVPRHPPNALLTLEIQSRPRHAQDPSTHPHRGYAKNNHAQGSQPSLLSTINACMNTFSHDRDRLLPTRRNRASGQTDTTAAVPTHHQNHLQLSNTTPAPDQHGPAGKPYWVENPKPPRRVKPAPWRRSGSNRRPPACKAGALPLSYAPAEREYPEPGKDVRPPNSPAGNSHRTAGMGPEGFEPSTPRLSSVCSDQLSYRPAGPRGETSIGEASIHPGRDALMAPDVRSQTASQAMDQKRHPCGPASAGPTFGERPSRPKPRQDILERR